MTHRHVLVLLCVVAVVLVSPGILAQETATPTANTTNESDTAGMGTQLTAFAQSSSAAANDSVENGMWQARFDQTNASEQAQLVTNRTGTLEQRLAQLQDRNESIQAQYENGTLPETAYVAQQSQLSARIAALQTAINDTDDAAMQAGVNASRLDALRQNASELSGPQVAAVARGLGGGPPADRPGGPPNETGPDGNETTPGGPPDEAGPPGNETGAPPDETGTPDNETGPDGNETGADGADTGSDGSNAPDDTTSDDSNTDDSTTDDTTGDAGDSTDNSDSGGGGGSDNAGGGGSDNSGGPPN